MHSTTCSCLNDWGICTHESATLPAFCALATAGGDFDLDGAWNWQILVAVPKDIFLQDLAQNRSLIILDIDHFKRVNDTWGHEAGDLVLKAVAGALAENVRASDLAARLGGEEFAVILADTGREGAGLFAERLRHAIMALEIAAAGACLRVTSSFGVAEARMPEPSIEAMLSSADAALYRSKTGGRNRVTIDEHPAGIL